jgi:MFS family permease
MARRRIRVRWWIFAFTFAFAMLSFIQRTSIAVAGESIAAALHITQVQVGLLNTAFLSTYTVAQIPAGALGGRLPTGCKPAACSSGVRSHRLCWWD